MSVLFVYVYFSCILNWGVIIIMEHAPCTWAIRHGGRCIGFLGGVRRVVRRQVAEGHRGEAAAHDGAQAAHKAADHASEAPGGARQEAGAEC